MARINVNHWDIHHPTGEGFLDHLRNSSQARVFCRQVIAKLIDANEASSILEVGVGGLNEIISMDEFFSSRPKVRYTGTDWTPAFIGEARKKFPRYNFQRLDITQCEIHEHLMSDIVYSQHVLEHCGGLNPPLSNMLQFAEKVLLNIFFLKPEVTDRIDYKPYPYYENRYGIDHIHHICNYHGFDSQLIDCADEVILCAVKRGCGIVLT